MRSLQTFILRLYIDPLEPHALRGSLRSIEHGDEIPFSDRAAFTQALEQLVNLSIEGQPKTETKMKSGRHRPGSGVAHEKP